MESKRTASEICHAFFRTTFDEKDIKAIGAFLTEDITWHGDTEMISANGKKPVLFILGYAIKNYMHGMRLKRIKLREKEIRSEICLVEGSLQLRDDVTKNIGFRFAALCIEQNGVYMICNMQFHMLKSTEECSYSADRMMNSLYDAMPFSVLIFEDQNGIFTPVYFNEAFANYLSLSSDACKESMKSDSLWFVIPEDQKQVWSRLAAASCGELESNRSNKFRVKTNSGFRWTRLANHAFRWVDQRKFIVVSLIDVTYEVDEQKQVQDIISRIPASICVFEIIGQQVFMTYISEDLPRLIGYTAEELCNHDLSNDLKYVHPDDIKVILQMHQRAREGERRIDGSMRFKYRAGGYWWTTLATQLFYKDENRRIYYGVFVNIDEKVCAEQLLVAREKESEDIITALPCGIAQFVYRAGVAELGYFSDRLCEIYGVSRAEFADLCTSDHPFGFLSDESVENDLLIDLIQGKNRKKPMLIKRTRKDSGEIWLRISCNVNRFDTTQKINMIIEDVTEETRLREAEMWQRERYRILSTSLGTTIFDYDPVTDSMTFETYSARDATEAKRLENVSQTICEYFNVHEDDAAAVRQLFVRMSSRVMRGSIDLRVGASRDELRWYRINCVSLAAPDGIVFRVLGRVDDIEQEKKKEHLALSQARREERFKREQGTYTLFAKMFDLAQNTWIPTEADILAKEVPGYLQFHNTLLWFCDHVKNADKCVEILHWLSRNQAMESPPPATSRGFEMRFRFSPEREVRWVQLKIGLLSDAESEGRFAYLILTDIDEQKKQEIEAWNAQNLDALTGLLNRQGFETKLKQVFTSMHTNSDSNRKSALVCIGCDFTGRLNKLLGYEEVDLLLKKMGQTILMALHDGDIACRSDGDKFMLLISKVENDEAIDENLRILCTLLRQPISTDTFATVSIGCVVLDANKEYDAGLIEMAYKALYTAKTRGGEQYVIFNTGGDDAGEEGKEISSISTTFSDTDVFIRTFGHFDVFVNDNAVYFNHPKAKELLALMVDRKGGFLSASDAISCLWEDMPADKATYAKYRKTAMQLKRILDGSGISYLVESKNGKRRVIKNRFICDYYMFEEGLSRASQTYAGQYMVDYSWAEGTIAVLDALQSKR